MLFVPIKSACVVYMQHTHNSVMTACWTELWSKLTVYTHSLLCGQVGRDQTLIRNVFCSIFFAGGLHLHGLFTVKLRQALFSHWGQCTTYTSTSLVDLTVVNGETTTSDLLTGTKICP